MHCWAGRGVDAGELPELRKGAKRGARGSESPARLEGKSEGGDLLVAAYF